MIKYSQINLLNFSICAKSKQMLNKFKNDSSELLKLTRKNKCNFRNTRSFNNLNTINKKFNLYKNHLPFLKKFSQKLDKEFFNTINEDFEKTLTINEEDKEKRVRLLSLKLLQINNSKEIITIFEEKYIKGLVNTIYGEEIALLIYFYVSILNRESGEDTGSVKSANVFVDKRLDRILKLLNTKLQELDTVNLLAICWAVSLLITKFNHEISDKIRKNIINSLPRILDVEKKGEIPTICFSISSFLSEDQELEEMIRDRITNYSNIFCKFLFIKLVSDEGLNFISALNLSLLMMSWTKIKLNDVDCLNSAANSLIELGETLTEENIDELCKIFWSFYILNFKAEIQLQNFLQSFIERNFDKIKINHALDLFISFSSLNSDNIQIFEMLIDIIVRNYETSDIDIDISNYVNIWLGISKFYLKVKEMSLESVSLMLKFLVSTYDIRPYLTVPNMNLDEICSMIVSLSALTLEPNKIYSDLGYAIKENISKFNNIQLIQLLSCGKYLFNNKKHSDLYFMIHEALVSSVSTFDNIQIKVICRILRKDKIIEESIFLDKKI